MPPKAIVTGPSAQLITKIQQLEKLVKNLPPTLPLNPPENETTYFFGLDQNEIKEEGVLFALTQNLERSFQTHALAGRPLLFVERGKRCESLIKLLKAAMRDLPSDRDREFVSDVWVERLINAAKDSGAKIPAKRRKIVSSESEADSEPTSNHRPQSTNTTASPSVTPIALDKSDSDAYLQQAFVSKPKRARTIVISSDSEPEATGSPVTLDKSIQAAISSVNHSIPSRLTQRTLTGVPVLSKTVPAPAHKPRRAVSPARKISTLDHHISQFKSMSMKERKESEARTEERMRQNRERILEQEKLEAERAEARKREANSARQRRFVERRRKLLGNHRVAKQAKQQLLGAVTTSGVLSDLAAVSRPDGVNWKKSRVGTKKGVVQGTHVRTNYFHPFLWCHIDRVARSVNYSATLTARILTTSPATKALFPKLRKGTIQAWLSTHGKRWSSHTLKKVTNRGTLAGTGRVGFLKKYPAIVDEVKGKLVALRTAGISLNRVLGRAIFVAIIRQRDASILETFKCSEWFVGQFYSSVLNWSLRKGTRAAAHIPDNAPELCERVFFRVVHLAMVYDIPAKLWINVDQLGMYIMPHNQVTYAEKGSRQVETHAKEEKRAYTLCVASSADGDFLPFQQIWSGKTNTSLPKASADGMEEALAIGTHFTVANSPKRTSHFSTLKTMQEWMTKILAPYIQQTVEANHLPNDQKAILFIDCYPVHLSLDFRTYVWEKFPNIFLIFVPANCTGIFQPADVGLQRVIKHHLRQAALRFLVDSHSQQIDSGLTPEQVKFTTSLPVLRDASVRAIVDAWEFMNGPSGRDLVRRAWEKCIAKEWCLAPDVVLSRRAKAAYHDYIKTDQIFREELAKKIGDIEGLPGYEPEPEQDKDDDGLMYDSTDVPLQQVIHSTLEIALDDATNHEDRDGEADLCVAVDAVDADMEDNELLRATGDIENVWAFDDEGEQLNDTTGSETI